MNRKPPSSKNQVSIFDQPIALRKALISSGHSLPYTQIIGIDALHTCSAKSLSRPEMGRVIAALLSRAPGAGRLAGVVQVFVYTTAPEGLPQAITVDETHAFSILTARGQRLRHHYFEKHGSADYRRYAPFSQTLSGPFDLDDIRLLHFARAAKRGLPAKSTIYEFNSGAWGDRSWVSERNTLLRVAVLRDPGRSWGAHTLGIYGDAVYRAMTGAEDENCSGFTGCPNGKKSCGFPPGGPEQACDLPPPQGDVFVDWTRAFDDHSIDPPDRPDFDLYKSLREKFLANPSADRRAVSDYYVAALFLKQDRESVKLYAQALPHLDRALRAWLDGADPGENALKPLRAVIQQIARQHRDVRNREFQRALRSVEQSVKAKRL